MTRFDPSLIRHNYATQYATQDMFWKQWTLVSFYLRFLLGFTWYELFADEKCHFWFIWKIKAKFQIQRSAEEPNQCLYSVNIETNQPNIWEMLPDSFQKVFAFNLVWYLWDSSTLNQDAKKLQTTTNLNGKKIPRYSRSLMK